MGPSITNLVEHGTRQQNKVMVQLAESGLPVFHVHAFCPVDLSKSWWKTANTQQRRPQTAELLFGTVIAFNQLKNYGAVAKWCNSESPPLTAEPQVEEHCP